MRRLVISILSIVVTLATISVSAAERIGVAAKVKSQVTGTVGSRTVALNNGDAVFHRQVISANAEGSAQLIFVDETVFSVSRGATVTLDKFIYNPARKSGSIILNVSKGAFRFISGVALPSTYMIKTPVATIGIRGTIFSGNVISRNYMTLNLQKGKLLICPERGKRVQGNLGRQTKAGPGQEDCTLVEPGSFSVGSGVGKPPGGDPDIMRTEPNESIDVLEGPVTCRASEGILSCN